MRTILTAAALACFATISSAATIDFTDGNFGIVSVNSLNQPLVVTEVSDGVTFTLSMTRAFDVFDVDSSGMDFGTPGNAMFTVSIVADQEVQFTSITGRSDSIFTNVFGNPTGATPFTIDYSAPGSGPFNIGFSSVSSEVGLFGGGVSVSAGDAFLIDHFDYRGTFNQGYISAIGFERLNAPPIPLPAGLPLLLTGIVGFGLLRRRKS